MTMLFADPAPTDLDGWRRHLEWLRGQADFAGRAASIADAELQISLLEAHRAETPAEGP